MEYAQTIIDATQEIFSSMVMLDTTPGIPFARANEPLIDAVSGTINMDGSVKYLLAIHLPSQTAMGVTEAFLGMEIEQVDEDVCDAIGELANMLAGNLKAAIDPAGSDIQLAIPESVFGDEYIVEGLAKAANITIPFYLEDGDFQVELQVLTES